MVTRLFALLVAVVFGFLTSYAHAGDCRKVGQVCVDTTPGKYIDGVYVSIDQAGGCWNYENTYECIKPNSVDYCSGIRNTAGCYQTSTRVKNYAFNDAVLDQTLTYRCNDV